MSHVDADVEELNATDDESATLDTVEGQGYKHSDGVYRVIREDCYKRGLVVPPPNYTRCPFFGCTSAPFATNGTMRKHVKSVHFKFKNLLSTNKRGPPKRVDEATKKMKMVKYNRTTAGKERTIRFKERQALKKIVSSPLQELVRLWDIIRVKEKPGRVEVLWRSIPVEYQAGLTHPPVFNGRLPNWSPESSGDSYIGRLLAALLRLKNGMNDPSGDTQDDDGEGKEGEGVEGQDNECEGEGEGVVEGQDNECEGHCDSSADTQDEQGLGEGVVEGQDDEGECDQDDEAQECDQDMCDQQDDEGEEGEADKENESEEDSEEELQSGPIVMDENEEEEDIRVQKNKLVTVADQVSFMGIMREMYEDGSATAESYVDYVHGHTKEAIAEHIRKRGPLPVLKKK